MSKFQNEFRRLRESQGLTQAELASALKIARSTVGMYEQGKREPDFETLEAIADFFNVSMSMFLEDGAPECELFIQCHRSEVFTIVQRFLKLDTNDRMAVSVMIDGLLSTDKYQEVKTVGEKSTSSEAV